MQTNRTRKATIVSTILLASSILLNAAVLDGTKWKIKVVPDKTAAENGSKEFEDELIFADGKLTSTALSRKDFQPSKYHSEAEQNEAEFEAEMVSGTNSVAVWVGEIRGTNALGGLQWMQVGRSNVLYEFSGTKQ